MTPTSILTFKKPADFIRRPSRLIEDNSGKSRAVQLTDSLDQVKRPLQTRLHLLLLNATPAICSTAGCKNLAELDVRETRRKGGETMATVLCCIATYRG
jgi:hypothetical protein